MNIQQAIELDLHKATKQELQQANKILTRALNRQLLGFRYGNKKGITTTEASFLKDFIKSHNGEYQVHIDRKPGEKISRNKMMSHVSDLQYWLKRKDSSVSKWKARIKTAPKFMTSDMKKSYEKLTVDEQNLFWKWFGKAKQDIINYEAGNLTRAVKAVLSNPDDITDIDSVVKKIKKLYEETEQEEIKKYKPFTQVFKTGKNK